MSSDTKRLLARYFALSQRIPGWTRGDEAVAIAEASLMAPADAVIVEVGSFFGCATVLMAGARKFRESGIVHAVDPFDGSGDTVSTPHYHALLLAFAGKSQYEHFVDNVHYAGVEEHVVAHRGTATEVAADWSEPIDLLFLDGDQSPAGAREAFDAWIPWLKADGIIALHNSADRDYEPEHDGHRQLVLEEIRSSGFDDERLIGSTTFARRVLP